MAAAAENPGVKGRGGASPGGRAGRGRDGSGRGAWPSPSPPLPPFSVPPPLPTPRAPKARRALRRRRGAAAAAAAQQPRDVPCSAHRGRSVGCDFALPVRGFAPWPPLRTWRRGGVRRAVPPRGIWRGSAPAAAATPPRLHPQAPPLPLRPCASPRAGPPYPLPPRPRLERALPPSPLSRQPPVPRRHATTL